MDGTIRFNRAYYPMETPAGFRVRAATSTETYRQSYQRRSGVTQIFISHKTGDVQADNIGQHIVNVHRIGAYLVEWDPNVNPTSTSLPRYLLSQIGLSKGFLVNVTPSIAISMWVGYEIGGANAYQIESARANFSGQHTNMPSVVDCLPSLTNFTQLDQWISSL